MLQKIASALAAHAVEREPHKDGPEWGRRARPWSGPSTRFFERGGACMDCWRARDVQIPRSGAPKISNDTRLGRLPVDQVTSLS